MSVIFFYIIGNLGIANFFERKMILFSLLRSIISYFSFSLHNDKSKSFFTRVVMSSLYLHIISMEIVYDFLTYSSYFTATRTKNYEHTCFIFTNRLVTTSKSTYFV